MTYLATFHTHFDAMKYLRFLKGRGIKGALKPVPRRISSSCGTCAVFDYGHSLEASELEEFTKEDVEGLYRIDGENHACLFQGE